MELAPKDLLRTVDPADLAFASTADLEPLLDDLLETSRIVKGALVDGRPAGQVADAENLEIMLRRVVLCEFHRRQLGISEHGKKYIVEIMGDASGKPADGFHLL